MFSLQGKDASKLAGNWFQLNNSVSVTIGSLEVENQTWSLPDIK